MADSKLSALPEATTISDTDELYIKSGTDSKRVSWSTVAAKVLESLGTSSQSGEPTAVTSEYAYSKVIPLTDGKAILIYSNNSNVLKAKCLTVTGSTIAAGSEETISNESHSFHACRMDATRAIIAYSDTPSGFAYARCISVSGATLALGTVQDFNATYQAYDIWVAGMDESHAIVCYTDANANAGRARCLTLSGTTVATNAAYNYIAGANDTNIVTKLTSTTALVTYRDTGSANEIKALCLSLATTTITGGATVTVEASAAGPRGICTMSPTGVLLSYTLASGGGYKNYLIGMTVDGLVITVGTRSLLINTSNSDNSAILTNMDAYHAFASYVDRDNGGSSVAQMLSLIGTTITMYNKIIIQSGAASAFVGTGATLTSSKGLIVYKNDANSYYGTAVCLNRM